MAYTSQELKKIPFFQNQSVSYLLDALTGTINRLYIIDYVKSLIEEEVPFSLYIVDIDNFKIINDEFGHLEGDRVLKRVSEELIEITKGEGLVGRYGGDEFLIVSSCVEYDAMWNFCKKLYSHVRKQKIIKINNAFLTLTTGAVSYPKDALNFEELFVMADKALYRGKQKGRNCFIIYSEALHKNIDLSNRMEQMPSLMGYVYSMITEKSSLENRVKSACTFICSLLSIACYFVATDGSVHSINSSQDLPLLQSDWLQKLLKYEPYIVVNDYSSLMQNHSDFHEYCWEHRIKSFALLKSMAFEEHFGYMLFVDYSIKRVWQKDDKTLLIYLCQLLSTLFYFEKK